MWFVIINSVISVAAVLLMCVKYTRLNKKYQALRLENFKLANERKKPIAALAKPPLDFSGSHKDTEHADVSEVKDLL